MIDKALLVIPARYADDRSALSLPKGLTLRQIADSAVLVARHLGLEPAGVVVDSHGCGAAVEDMVRAKAVNCHWDDR